MSKILLISDDATLAKKITKELRDFDVSQASDVKRAIHLVETEKPDLILLDWSSANLHGLETVSALRSSQLTKKLPIMVLTSLDDPQIRAQLGGFGAVAYLDKVTTEKNALADKVYKLLSTENLDIDFESSQ